MRITALRILEKIKGADTEDCQDAMKEYAALVDRFYQANEDHMAKKAMSGCQA